MREMTAIPDSLRIRHAAMARSSVTSTRPRTAARSASRPGAGGSTSGCAWPAARSAAVTHPRTAMRASMRTTRVTRSSAARAGRGLDVVLHRRGRPRARHRLDERDDFAVEPFRPADDLVRVGRVEGQREVLDADLRQCRTSAAISSGVPRIAYETPPGRRTGRGREPTATASAAPRPRRRRDDLEPLGVASPGVALEW